MTTLHSPNAAARRFPRALRPTPIAIALALVFAPGLVPCAQAQTLPSQPTVVHGSASFSRPAAGQLNVQQASQNAIINWQSFSIGANGQVVFRQPNAQAIALNRVTGGEASTILGSLSANGRVFLVNPSGVLFGAGASVNVGGLVASTLNVADSDFIAGRYRFSRDANAAPASVVNEGRLQAAPGGTIALVGSTVRNNGTIEAPQGTAALAAGKTVTLDFQGDGLTQLRVTEADLQALAANGGTLAADGGRVLMLADATQASGFVVNQSGIVRARSLTSGPDGVVVLGGGAGDVSVTGTIDAQGGSVAASGRNVGVLDQGRIDAGGGQVTLSANATNGSGGVVAIGADAHLGVDGIGSGSGGRIELNGASVHANGSLSARGGTSGGDGGTIKFNVSGGVDTLGLRADASAAHGRAGMLNIDPFDVTIVDDSGLALPPVALNPFVPVGNTFVGTRAINAALNTGTDVTITTGTLGDGGTGGSISLGQVSPFTLAFGSGSITFGTSVTINRITGAAPATLRLDAARDIRTVGLAARSITSSAGPLNIDFDSNALGAADGSIFLTDLTLRTNGGAVRMFGLGNPALPSTSSGYGILLNTVTIDTRIGQSDANPGGAITLRGQTPVTQLGLGQTGVRILFSTLRSSSGAITLDGRFAPAAEQGNGIDIFFTTIGSTSGPIAITGIGQSSSAPSTAAAPITAATGVDIGLSDISSTTGTIDIRGHAGIDPGSTGTVSTGVQIADASSVTSTAGGGVFVSGSTADSGRGVVIAAPTISDGIPIAGSSVGGGNVVLRASNGGLATSAVSINAINASGIVNLRPGSVDAAGAVSDRSDVPINLGGNTGFGLSATDLAGLTAQTVVIGSSGYNGVISVQSATTSTNNLTLQTGPFGGIAINAPLDAGTNTLALATGGNLTQAAGAPLTAASLLLRSGGAALLDPGNSVGTLAAVIDARTLDYMNNRALSLGPVAATGFDPGGNVATALDARSLTYAPAPVALTSSPRARPLGVAPAAPDGTMVVRTSAGSMTLDGDIVATGLDLVTPATFQNIANSTVTAPNGWRLWANTWVGETRGGLQGSQPQPNLYGCTFGVSCGAITIPTAGGTFIYTQRPTLTVTADSQSRLYGDPNAPLGFAAAGFINGDLPANALAGAPSTSATVTSSVGSYAISTAGFSSPVGYLVTPVNGTLTVTPATLTFDADRVTRSTQQPNPAFSGAVSGWRNGDTLAGATTGTLTWTSPANNASPPGSYAIDGGGLAATNYRFVQGQGNATALTITAAISPFEQAQAIAARELGSGAIEARRDGESTYVYDRNLGLPQMCVPDTPLDADLTRSALKDLLAVEWSRLRSRPNISNCFDSGRRSGCSDF